MATKINRQLSDSLLEDIENNLHTLSKEQLLAIACEAELQFNEGHSLEAIREDLKVYPKEDLVDAVSDSLAINGAVLDEKGQLMLGAYPIPVARGFEANERESMARELGDIVKSMDIAATDSNPLEIAARYRKEPFDDPMAWAKGERPLALSNGTKILFGHGWSIKEVDVPQGTNTDRSVIEEYAGAIRELGQSMYELDSNPTRGRDRDAGMELGR